MDELVRCTDYLGVARPSLLGIDRPFLGSYTFVGRSNRLYGFIQGGYIHTGTVDEIISPHRAHINT